MKKAVISLGGSIMVRGEEDHDFLRKFSDLILSLSDELTFIIITGGGRTARDNIHIGRELGCDEVTLDNIGIQATRLNAWLLISALGEKCHPQPVNSVEEALISVRSSGIVVGGGTHPGHTTDTVAALIAERWCADIFLNLTAVNGAYTSDPNKFDDAEKIERISSAELVELVSATSRGAGSHSVMDPLAARIIRRANLVTFIMNGRDLDSVGRCLNGKDFDGTTVFHAEEF
jgi:uridylate kinase